MVENPWPIVVVEWLDSAGNANWMAAGKAQDMRLSHCVSVGFLMRNDDEQVVLSQSFDPPTAGSDETVTNVMHLLCIPKIAVTNVRRLVEPSA